MATGNLVTRSQLDVQQSAGFTIVPDKLNLTRYLSHFRSIHRGQYFTEMKTTTVRKLLPESWGFTCPVHTPDGAPCGLLNHITLSCAPIGSEECEMKVGHFKTLMASLGMQSQQTDFNLIYPIDFLPVMLDGVLLGYVDPKLAPAMVNKLRYLKMKQNTAHELEGSVPMTLEVAFLAPGRMSTAKIESEGTQRNYYFPGIYLSSQVARFVRPVQNLVHGGVEWIGPLEQITLNIATLKEDLRSDITH